MPLPILLGVSAAAVLANSFYRSEIEKQDKQRKLGLKARTAVGRYPCDHLPSEFQITPGIGSIVCCGVYNGFIHTGLVIDDDLVLELHGSGLSRAISFKRFLQDRSGQHIFVATDTLANPIIFDFDQEHVARQVFAYHDYHVSKRNCYSHSWYCLTGKMTPFASFELFNKALSSLVGHSIYWDRAKIKKLTS